MPKKRKKSDSSMYSSNRGTFFFAYQSKEKSGSCVNVDAIQSAARSLGAKAVTWESMKTNGKLINKQILSEIDRTETFACDLTYLNANVFFELCYAMGKKVLLVAPKPYYAPIDYNDILIEYDSASDCVERITSWLPKKKKPSKAVMEEDKELNLLKLGIGYSIAEDEKTDLIGYFVETYAYNLALKSISSIFFGRKGTGKTALYIKLCDEFSQYENTYLIGLKPESTELIENIHAINLYQDTASKKSLFHSICKYVIYSKIMVDIYNDIYSKQKIEYDTTEQNIIDFYNENSDFLQLNFIGTLKVISDRSKDEGLSVQQVIETYNRSLLSRMLGIIKDYFRHKKYYKIAILADNLDKAWDAESDLSLQSEMILSLLEVSGKLQQELIDKSDKKVDTTVILFLRLDIYKFVIARSREPDKLTVASHEVEWGSYKELLKKLVEKKLCMFWNYSMMSILIIYGKNILTLEKTIHLIRYKTLVYLDQEIFYSSLERCLKLHAIIPIQK